MKILLIAGHGNGDPGALGNPYKEAEETRKLVSNIERELKAYADVTVYNTNRNAYKDAKNGVLGKNANFTRYDYVLEVHFNAFKTDKGDGKVKGSEIYVTTREKGVTVEEGSLKNIQKLGFTNRGVKRNNYTVINTAKNAGVSSALFEACFIDDADDMALYEKNRTAFAKAVAEGIAQGFKLKKTDTAIDQYRKIIKDKAGLEEKTLDYLEAYASGEALLRKLAEAMK